MEESTAPDVMSDTDSDPPLMSSCWGTVLGVSGPVVVVGPAVVVVVAGAVVVVAGAAVVVVTGAAVVVVAGAAVVVVAERCSSAWSSGRGGVGSGGGCGGVGLAGDGREVVVELSAYAEAIPSSQPHRHTAWLSPSNCLDGPFCAFRPFVSILTRRSSRVSQMAASLEEISRAT